MKELKEFLEKEIKDARVYFKDTEHFEQVFDVGYIKAFEAVLREIQNKYE